MGKRKYSRAAKAILSKNNHGRVLLCLQATYPTEPLSPKCHDTNSRTDTQAKDTTEDPDVNLLSHLVLAKTPNIDIGKKTASSTNIKKKWIAPCRTLQLDQDHSPCHISQPNVPKALR